jgi:CubicO group peptidase (beta-lactamase class C family)
VALALAGLALAAPPAPPTQYPGPASPYNPYTGRGAARPVGVNPFTGAAPQAAAGYNPYTGVNAAAEKHGIPGGALAIVKDGKLVLARGYGWGNLVTGAPVTPDAIFGIASLSKSLPAVAVLKLVEQGKLGLEDRAFRLLSHLKAPPGARVDPRLDTITVRHLLNHSGGWDRNKSGDPQSFSRRVARRLRVPLPVNATTTTRCASTPRAPTNWCQATSWGPCGTRRGAGASRPWTWRGSWRRWTAAGASRSSPPP